MQYWLSHLSLITSLKVTPLLDAGLPTVLVDIIYYWYSKFCLIPPGRKCIPLHLHCRKWRDSCKAGQYFVPNWIFKCSNIFIVKLQSFYGCILNAEDISLQSSSWNDMLDSCKEKKSKIDHTENVLVIAWFVILNKWCLILRKFNGLTQSNILVVCCATTTKLQFDTKIIKHSFYVANKRIFSTH